MVFTYKKDISECQIHIDKFPIERVLVTKFLGVLIDEKLTWKVHINFVITKIKRSMAMLFKIKDKLNQDSLLTIVVVDQFTPGYQFTPTSKFIQNNHS